MKIYIIRHGEKENGNYYNEKLRHQDFPLTRIGETQGERLKEYFKDKQIKKIYISEYLRTGQTAGAVATLKGLEPVVDKRLNEIDNGIIEDMSDEEIKEKYPKFWEEFFSYSRDVRFPEGENGEEVRLRQKELLDNLIQNDEDVILFSHEGYIRLLMCHILDIPVYKRFQFKVDFCGITEMEYNTVTKKWCILKFNQTLQYSEDNN